MSDFATETVREALSINAAVIDAASHNGVTNTGFVDMSKFYRATFIGSVGTLGSSGTIDCSLYESDLANGAAPNNLIAGSAITQITAANQVWTVEVCAAQMTRRYLGCYTNNLVAASVYSVIPVGCGPRDHPANGFDISAVTERLVV